MVSDGISGGNCHVAETEDFLSKIFPVDSTIVDEVYKTLVANKSYDIVNRSWKDLPINAKKESTYYTPFVNTAESIRLAHTSRKSTKLSCEWLDRHSNSPKSRDQDASLIRPDILCILGMGKREQPEWEMLTNDKYMKKRLKAAAAWWLRVNVPVEIKPVESDDMLKYIKQLLGYMRQVLREQVDRRFVPGFLLSRTGLRIWLCDRSGVLGTRTAINIHEVCQSLREALQRSNLVEDPKNFIRIILACSSLPPERLGWDTTMRLCRQPINPQALELVHSYDPSVTLRDHRNSLYNTHWVIDMPSNDDEHKREEFITIRALSVVEAQCMSGRATTVWAVIKVEDLRTKASPHKIYVFEQCWRPTAGRNEGDFYLSTAKTENSHLGRIYSYEDVLQDGNPVDTQAFVRQGLAHLTLGIQGVNTNGKRESQALADAEDKERYLDIFLMSDKARVKTSTWELQPIWRTFARMLLEDYGWPLKNFRDLLELTTASRHIITGHKWLYFQGVLHRDISIGNALICPKVVDGVMSTEGRLIDLDCAKCTDNFIGSLLYRAKHEPPIPPNPVKKMKARKMLFEISFDATFTDDVIKAIMEMRSELHWESFAATMLDYKPSLQNSTISAQDIGLLNEDQSLPNFTERVAENRQRIATLPYASPEILTGRVMFAGRPGSTFVVHNAVHDMEAFFWAFVYLCITRGGPGGRRRDELKPGTLSTPETQQLFLIADCFFYSDDINDLAANKRDLFTKDHFAEYILPHLHPYFKSLESLLLRWWKILRIAHQYPIFETIHDWFLDALNDTILSLEKHPPTIHPESYNVDAFSREDLRSLQYFPVEVNCTEKFKDVMWDLSPSNDTVPKGSGYLSQHVNSPPSSPTLNKSKKRRTGR